jgi:hypothetical protein
MTFRTVPQLDNRAALRHVYALAVNGPWRGRVVQTIAHHAALLLDRLGVFYTLVRAELDDLDGYPSTASGSDKGRGSNFSTTTPTERVVLARLGDLTYVPSKIPGRRGYWVGENGPAADEADFEQHVQDAVRALTTAVAVGPELERDWLDGCRMALAKALEVCDRYAPVFTEADWDRARCLGTGDAKGAKCDQYADVQLDGHGHPKPGQDGRCIDCRRSVGLAEDAQRKRKKYHEVRRTA